MASLLVLSSHVRDGKFYSGSTYVEVPDSEVENFLRPYPELGFPLFARVAESYSEPVKAPKDFFEDIHAELEKNKREAIEAELAADAAREEAAKLAQEQAPVEAVETVEAEPAPEPEAEAAEEEVSPAEEAASEAPRTRRRTRTAE